MGVVSLVRAQGFLNVAPGMGIEVTNINGLYGSGMSLYDYDLDGWDDLTLGVNGTGIRTYRNTGGALELQPQLSIPMTHNPKAVQWVDVDEDGDMDLFVVQDGGPTRIFERLFNGQLMERTGGSGLPVDGHLLSCAAWADVDGDGDLDVYIGAYAGNVAPGDPTPTQTNLLFRNEGNFQFSNQTENSNTSNGIGLTLAVLFLDVDNDLDPDLLVANDKHFPNALYLNDGNGVFSDASAAWGFDMLIDAMTLSEADFNADGLRDVLITNTVNGQGLENEVYSLIPGATAQNITTEHFGTQLHDRYMWGGCWFDFDNDGDRDLFIAEHDLGNPFQENPLFINSGAAGGYVMEWAPDSVFAPDFTNAHVVVQGDWDGNGWPDLAVHNVGNHKLRLWRNMHEPLLPEHHWVKIEPVGVVSNSMGIGAWIEVFWDHPASPYRAYTFCGQDFLGQTARKHHVGLGPATGIDSIRVIWPSGVVDVVLDPPMDGTVVVTEGATWIAQVGVTGPQGLCPGAAGTLTAQLAPGVGILWPNGSTGTTYPLQGPGTVGFHWVVNGVPFPATHAVAAYPPASLVSTPTSPSCAGASDGTWQGSFVQSGSPVAPSLLTGWSFFVNGVPWNGVSPLTGLPASSLWVQWMTAQGCPGTAGVTLSEPAPLEVSWSPWSPDCSGDSALAWATPSGGTPPYQLHWDGITVPCPASGLAIGTSQPNWSGTWMDANGCFHPQSQQVELFAPLEVGLSVAPSPEGTALVPWADGGLPEYNWRCYFHPFDPPLPEPLYLLPGWNGGPLFSPSWGHYLMEVEDANGCMASLSFQWNESGLTFSPHEEVFPTSTAPQRPLKPSVLSIWPNPATEILQIDAPQPVTCSLLSLTGTTVVAPLPQDNKIQMDVQSIAAGTYCLCCTQAPFPNSCEIRHRIVVN